MQVIHDGTKLTKHKVLDTLIAGNLIASENRKRILPLHSPGI